MRTLPVTLLLLCLLAGLQSVGCFEGEGSKDCLQGAGTNASARVDGMTVDLNGSGKMEQGISPTPTGPVWTSQLTIRLDINKVECSHNLTFWVDNPAPGEAILSGQIQEGSPNFTGVYAGELGSFPMQEGSTLKFTSFGSSAAGTFKAVLEDGTVFSSGKFQGIPVN